MLLLVVLTGAGSCASEEIPNYGDPAQVAGGVGGAGGSATTTNAGGGTGGTTSSTCDVVEDCDVSFVDDIFPILDKGGTQGCAVTTGGALPCHSESKGNLTLIAGDPASYYAALLAYDLDDPAGPYIAPCDPDGSKILCNLQVSDGEAPAETCGTLMPLVKANAPTQVQLQALKDWIACGAPDN